MVHFYKQDISKYYSSNSRYFYDPSWKNNLRSIKTTKYCQLNLKDEEYSGPFNQYPFWGEIPETRLLKVMSAHCLCIE
jgi:hypothetical protein